MFTGLVEAVGTIAESAAGAGARLRIRTALAGAISPGESLAVNGVCLTAMRIDGDFLDADLGPETLRVTTLGRLKPGQIVNLERPMKADGRLGGHFVLGHVDGIGKVEELRREEDAWWLGISVPPALERYLIPKGSIAVDGISLTVARLRGGGFDVQIIPFTFQHTNLKAVRAQDAVNLECDMVGKYVVRALELTGGIQQGG